MREFIHLIFNKRFRTIFFMFFGFFLQFWQLSKTKRFMSREKGAQKYRDVYTYQAKKFTRTAIALGGLTIKLGQFVSSRVDILPKEYTDILAELQDSVDPVETKFIIKRIEEELSGSIGTLFAEFSETPVAAASLGQVHKASLKSGEMVAVKVMRPGIQETVALDLSVFKVLIAFAKKFTKVSRFVDLEDVYTEFQEVTMEELDYKQEAAHIDMFRQQFKDFPGICVPNVYWGLTTNKVLVMEFIEGVKINEVNQLEGINPKKLASILYLSYLKQLMEDGFFHADPHPGNLLVKKDGTLAYIDFGMVGTVSKQMKESMIKLAMSIYLKDAGGIVSAFDELGFLRKQADQAALMKNVRMILAGFSDDGFSFKNIQNEAFLEELREFLYQQPFQIPSKTTFLGKAIITVFSICNGLDENFDLVKMTKPYVEDLMNDSTANSAKETVLDQIKETFFNIIPTIRRAGNLLEQLESGEFRMSPPKSFERKMVLEQSAQTRKIVMALFGAGLLIAGAQLLDKHSTGGVVFMAVGGIITLLQAAGSGHRDRRPHRRHPSFKMKN